jgi:high affinity sulfate transporter 1
LDIGSVPREFAAGFSIAAVAIPISLAFAGLVGVPPVFGLYASMFSMVGYALFGPSRYLVVGPDTATCLLVASALTALGLQGADQRIAASSALALIAGVGFGLASAARLGFIASLLSRPILVGYMGGVALTLLISQIPNFTGVPIEAPGLIRPVIELVQRRQEIDWLTVALAVGCLLVLQTLKRTAPRVPGPVVVVIGAILLSWGFDLQAHGVAVMGPIPAGLPALTIPRVSARLADVGLSVLSLLLVSFVSGAMTARGFGQKLGLKSDGNLELRGFAAANIASGLFQGFPVTGADSRTAANLAAGGRTALAPIAASLLLGVVVAALTAPLALLPQAALGAVLANAALGLMDFRAFGELAKIGRQELFFALIALLGVFWVGVLQGVFLAIAATLIHLLGMLARPRMSQRGWMPGYAGLVDLASHPTAKAPPDGVIFKFGASLLFINADYFQENALGALQGAPDARWFVLDASSIPYVDSTAIAMLLDFGRDLEGRGLHFAIAGGHGRFREILDRVDISKTTGALAVHPTTSLAVAHMRALSASRPRA